MRCEVCGRPYDGEALLPREIACQGCHAEVLVLEAAVDAEGKLVRTRDQALADARGKHYAREHEAHAALVLKRYERNAAGLDCETGLPLIAQPAEIVAIKSHAAEIVALLKRGG
jgi:hypothetical protein